MGVSSGITRVLSQRGAGRDRPARSPSAHAIAGSGTERSSRHGSYDQSRAWSPARLSVWSGGARRLAAPVGRPRWSRICRMTAGCSITAITVIVPPQRGHRRGSISYTFRIRRAQDRRASYWGLLTERNNSDGGPHDSRRRASARMPRQARLDAPGTLHRVILRGTRADGGRSRGPRKLPHAPRALPRRDGAAARSLHVGDCESGRESRATISPLSQQRPALRRT